VPAPAATGVKNLGVALESDGLPIGVFEEYSAKPKKLSDEEWRKQVLANLDASGNTQFKNVANYLRERNWTNTAENPRDNDAALKSWLDNTRYDNGQETYTKKPPVPDMPTHRKLWQHLHNADLALEGDWQYPTSVSYVKDGTTTYAHAINQPGVVHHEGAVDAPLGSFVKVTSDKNADNPLQYARVLDSGGSGYVYKKDADGKYLRDAAGNRIRVNDAAGNPLHSSTYEAEMNIAARRNSGAVDPNPATGGDSDPYAKAPEKVDVTPIAENPGGSQLTPNEALDNENTQYGGWLAEHKHEPYSAVSSQKSLDATMEKYKDDEEFKAYKQKVKDALKWQKLRVEWNEFFKSGGDHFIQGLDDVLCGDEQRKVVVCHSLTKNGDKSAEGIWGVYGGPDRQPVTVVGNATEQSKHVENGAEHVGVGGPPTSLADQLDAAHETVSPFGKWQKVLDVIDKRDAAKTPPAR
jgi:hypothetical protein